MITEHQILVFLAMKEVSADWIDSLEVAKRAGIAKRTASRHLASFAQTGVVEKKPIHPAPKFRLAPACPAHLELEQVAQILGYL